MSKPRLFVFGDSWPYGHVTEDVLQEYDKEKVTTKNGIREVQLTQVVTAGRIQNNFPYVLSQLLGIEVRNRGMSSLSNTAIIAEFWDYIINDYREGDIILMCWTSWDRLTVRGDKMGHKGYSPNTFANHFSSFTTGRMMVKSCFKLKQSMDMPDSHVDTTETLEDDYFKLLQSVSAYHMFKNICNEKNIKYLQTSSFCHDGFNNKISPIWDRNDPNWIESDCEHNTLMDIIMNRWKRQAKKIEFKKWIRAIANHNTKNGYRYFNKLDLHPNEEGHKLIAETLAPYIKRKLEE